MSRKGTTWEPTDETRKKMSESAKGRVPWNKGLKGHPSCKGFTGSHSEETKKKISESRKGKAIGNKNRQGHEPWNKGIEYNVHTKEWREKVSKANSGSNHWNWKGGIDSENRIMRNSSKHKEWAKSVYEYDRWTCQYCGYKGKKIIAHHIKSWADFPDLRFETSNGITLCRSCHVKIHKPSKKD